MEPFPDELDPLESAGKPPASMEHSTQEPVDSPSLERPPGVPRRRGKSTVAALSTASRLPRLRSLTRLVLGSVELGMEVFFDQLERWEEMSEKSSPQDQPSDHTPADQPTPGVQARQAMIGWTFDAQERLLGPLLQERRFRHLLLGLANPLISPLHTVYQSPLFTPLWQTVDRFAERGEQELARWIASGQQEEQHSRQLARVALDQTIDQTFRYLTENPEVTELVETQSTSLANELVEEVRERSVSADTLLEGMARSLLHRPARAELPGSPEAVRTHAASLRPRTRKK
jgi:hypothetical protein